jgi:hypothetical protein
MGWHSGIVAARAPWSAFAAALHDVAGIAVGEPVAVRTVERDAAFGGEYGGRSYALDPLMVTSANGDLVAALARELDTLVIGVGAETVSGSSWLFVAERDRLLCVHWALTSQLDAALDEGDWHRELVVHDLDGYGVYAALERGGFDLGAFLADRGAKLRLLESDERLPYGAIGAKIEAFCVAHRIPAEQIQKPQIVVRTDMPPPPGRRS